LTVIVGNELEFADALPKLMPHNTEGMQKAFAAPGMPESTAMRNGSLQGAYLIIAARALGLDCGCPGSTTPALTRRFLPARASSRTSSAASATEIQPQYFRAIQGFLSFEEAGHFE
jgi:3-hydroxypropanoate dehydrogenase